MFALVMMTGVAITLSTVALATVFFRTRMEKLLATRHAQLARISKFGRGPHRSHPGVYCRARDHSALKKAMANNHERRLKAAAMQWRLLEITAPAMVLSVQA